MPFFNSQNHKHIAAFTKEAMDAIKQHNWPGNIRELRNVVERAVILCNTETIGTEHLPGTIRPTQAQPKLGDDISLDRIEEEHIRHVLASTRSLQEVADILGIDQATLCENVRLMVFDDNAQSQLGSHLSGIKDALPTLTRPMHVATEKPCLD